uniref:Uncharacterized protein n=1 Tax=Anguilla anguilla TaxID=7936 RepID=A0A0E9W4N0_ANGAN
MFPTVTSASLKGTKPGRALQPTTLKQHKGCLGDDVRGNGQIITCTLK